MILNASQISETKVKLQSVLVEQKAILEDAEKVIVTKLSGAWECQAQKAYRDAFIAVKNSTLSQINQLIELFGIAFEKSQDGLYQVNVDLSTMNATAIM